MPLNTGRKVRVAFGVALLILCVIGVSAIRSTLGLVESARWVAHSDQVVEAVQTMLLGVRDAERSSRGYVITGDKAYLHPYRRAVVPTLEAFGALRTLTVDNAAQQERLDRLHPRLLRRLDLLRTTVVLRKRAGFAAALALIVRDEGRRVGEQIDQVTGEMLHEEGRLREGRTAAATDQARTTLIVVLAGTMIAFTFVAAASWAIRRDLAERTRMEHEVVVAKEAADAANRAKSHFLANVSHEIRTPMNGVLGLTDLVLAMDLPPQARSHLAMVKSSADSLLAVINDILDFSKIEAGRMELDPEPFGLRDALGATLKALAVRADAKKLELVFHVNVDVPDELIGDVGRLRQIVINLVGNAIKFTEQGEVVVEITAATSSDGKVELGFAVADSGIGIAPEKREAVFHPFEQADSSTTRRYGGTGLGLAISTELVGMMGGRLWIEDNVPRGTVFRFTARFGVAPPAPGVDTGLDAAGLRDLPVLIVDDNATNRTTLSEMLCAFGMAPVAVASGREALARASDAQAAGVPFALVLLDARMPGMDGFRVAERLSETASKSATVMMLTSDVGPDSVQRCHALGVAAYLVKPVTKSDLLDAIVTALRRRTAPAAPAGLVVRTRRCLHVLLVEDNPVNQALGVALLLQRGHTVVVAGTGREALGALAHARFDAAFMDVQMPDMDGYEATAAIRARERGTGSHLPIIAMTAHSMPGDRERCLAAGMDAYVSKPIEPAALFAALETMVPPAAVVRPPDVDDEVIDVDALLERVDGDGDLLRRLVTLFQESAPKSLHDIQAAVERGDAAGVVHLAHSLKGSAAVLGARDVPILAERLERMGREAGLDDATEVCRDLEAALNRFEPALVRLAEEAGGRSSAGTTDI